MNWMIEGTWSGYTTSQRKIAHREYTNDAKFAEAAKKLSWIRYTDGTTLSIHVSELTLPLRTVKKTHPPMPHYETLIRECIAAGVNFVDAL